MVALPVLLLLGTVAPAAPQHVRVSWCGGSTATTMCVAWNDPSGGGSQVQYGLSQTLTESASATSQAAPDPLGTVWEAELIDLAPNMTYHYRVGGGGGPWSDTYTFTTGPKDGCLPFTFVVLGDNRSDDTIAGGANVKWSPILAEAVAGGAAFVVNSGDLIHDGEQPAQWEDYLSKTDPIQAGVPLLSTIGNHDDDKVSGEGALYNRIFNLPRNDANDTEDFYYVIYGDAIVVSLTTQNFTDDAFKMQAEWLDKVLTEHPMRWKIVFFHHPVYSSNKKILGLFAVNHPPNEKQQNGAFVPIFDKHHVDLVFAGHNHYYERFEAMKGGGSSDQGVIADGPENGTTYFITGGAGAFTFDEFDLFGINIDLITQVCGDAVGSVKCDGRHHFLRVTIDGGKLTLDAVATSTQMAGTDPKYVEVFDSISIEKEGPACAVPPPPPEPGPEPAAEPAPEPAPEPPPEPPPVVAEPTDQPSPDGGGPVESPDAGTPAVAPDTGTGGPIALPADTGAAPPPTGSQSGAGATAGDEGGGCAAAPTGGSGELAMALLCLALLGLARSR